MNIGYFYIMVIRHAQCYAYKVRAAEVSGCDKMTVVLLFQAPATVKIWANSEHFENSDQQLVVGHILWNQWDQSIWIYW